MKRYNPQEIEKKWQRQWYKSAIFKAKYFSKKKKLYLLFEFPYPSGEGLHVGHCRPYIGMDVIARKKRMEGYNVLFPIGWDAFGLPTENYALKTGIHPAVATKKNTDNFRRQMNMLGLSLDWSREINTTDPKYYRWTQWIFIKLFENGLAYKDKMMINWCKSCKIGLANEEVVHGKCERCGTVVEKREKDQWLIRITKYAARLLDDLSLVDFPERVKVQQKAWIGRSEGALVKFPVEGSEEPIKVFTTRIDTIFSGTFLVLSPDHPFIDVHQKKIENFQEITEYRNRTKNISDMERSRQGREVTGVELKGVMARNPATNEEIPIWAADFVLEHYGRGAVFGDAHDKRDFDMAKKYGIALRTSVMPADESFAHRVKNLEDCYESEGILYNSMQFDGLFSTLARPRIISWLRSKDLADQSISYKLRDWVFSRQHYWGEPIPMIFCENCRNKSLEHSNSNVQVQNAGWVPVSEKDLPVELPKIKKYQPTDTGESPLSTIKSWVNVKCPACKGWAKRETDTMPNWAGSNWYYLRYLDPKNNRRLADERKMSYWMPVDWYNGGMEHTTLHLLYSRFIFKFLWDIAAVPNSIGSEPYRKRTSHGIILGPGGIKMSKSRGNVVNPDTVVRQSGADALRVYEMFMGPFEQMIPWDPKGIVGCRRFLEKVYKLCLKFPAFALNLRRAPAGKLVSLKLWRSGQNSKIDVLLNKTIKKVGKDIDAMKFNTAIGALMEFTNAWNSSGSSLNKKDLQNFLVILSPFAPHLTQELWQIIKFRGLCSQQNWPRYNEKLIKEEKVLLIVQINGKVRDKIEISAGISQKEAEKTAIESEKVKKWLEDKQINKIIFVQDRLINIVL